MREILGGERSVLYERSPLGATARATECTRDRRLPAPSPCRTARPKHVRNLLTRGVGNRPTVRLHQKVRD
jgi:hypothetical protein